MIDNISKFLIEQYSADFAAWLLGEAITPTTINPTELNVELALKSVLTQVVRELEQIIDPREKSNLAAATSILAGLQLNEQTIRQFKIKLRSRF